MFRPFSERTLITASETPDLDAAGTLATLLGKLAQSDKVPSLDSDIFLFDNDSLNPKPWLPSAIESYLALTRDSLTSVQIESKRVNQNRRDMTYLAQTASGSHFKIYRGPNSVYSDPYKIEWDSQINGCYLTPASDMVKAISGLCFEYETQEKASGAMRRNKALSDTFDPQDEDMYSLIRNAISQRASLAACKVAYSFTHPETNDIFEVSRASLGEIERMKLAVYRTYSQPTEMFSATTFSESGKIPEGVTYRFGKGLGIDTDRVVFDTETLRAYFSGIARVLDDLVPQPQDDSYERDFLRLGLSREYQGRKAPEERLD
jgi:hypothetical protein